ECPQRLAAQLQRLLDDALRLADAPAAQAPLEVVHVCAREAGERRAQKAVEIVPPAAEPLEAQQREERLAERGLADPQPALDRERDAERAEGGLERRPEAVEVRADEEDPLRRGPAAHELEDLLGDELERPARARALEEANRALDGRALGRLLREEVPLEVGERGRCDLPVAGWKLLDAAVRERGQIVRGPPERLERRAVRLVRERDRHLDPPGQCLDEGPLGAGQVLEPVREHRPTGPGVELARDPLDGIAALEVAVPELEPVELGTVRGVKRAEIALEVARLDEPGLELGQRTAERVGEPGEARGWAEPVQRGRGDGGADEQLALGVGDHRSRRPAVARELAEDIVEGADPPREQRALAGQQLSLDALDV